MSKSTFLNQLLDRWHQQKSAIHRRTFCSAGRPSKELWLQIFNAHARRRDRQRKIFNRASLVARRLQDSDNWAGIIRSNRKLIGMEPVVTRFGDSGTPRSSHERA